MHFARFAQFSSLREMPMHRDVLRNLYPWPLPQAAAGGRLRRAVVPLSYIKHDDGDDDDDDYDDVSYEWSNRMAVIDGDGVATGTKTRNSHSERHIDMHADTQAGAHRGSDRVRHAECAKENAQCTIARRIVIVCRKTTDCKSCGARHKMVLIVAIYSQSPDLMRNAGMRTSTIEGHLFPCAL